MKNLLVDTNIVLDLLAKREPFYEYSARLFSLSDRKKIKLYVSSITFLNSNYILSKELPERESKEILRKFKLLVKILSCDEKIIDLGLNSNFKDFEDSVQYYTAIENSIDCIITRNLKDFKESKIPVMTAETFIKSYK
ncbi:MAG: PIN domain-containing protein [Bacteroidia bacterium]|nr:PIN domain-containing protein [Bacteroidia bacterium]